MTSEEQRIAIAEACGWKWERYEGMNGSEQFGWFDPEENIHWNGEKLAGVCCLPDYLNDLNACAEMEGTLTGQNRNRYHEWLHYVCDANEVERVSPWTATAEQRAEAFGRTLNLWTS